VVRVACVLTVEERTQLNGRKCWAVACNQGTMFTNDWGCVKKLLLSWMSALHMIMLHRYYTVS
jgi:hypothetical protein